MPNVYNRRHTYPADAVYVGRPSRWGNPFKVGRDGTRAEVIRLFEVYARKRLVKEPDWLDPLKGKDLVCWCAPEDCHADVLLRLANDTSRPFAIRSNRIGNFGFRMTLCEGQLHEDSTVTLTWTGNEAEDTRGEQWLHEPLHDNYDSLDGLLVALTSADVRCIYWVDTKEYQYINKR